MRQTHVAGDKAFVDFSGKKFPITDPITGAVREAEFITVLGTSNLTYAEATWTQGLPDWIGTHVRMFRFSGARPRLLVPDNLRSGVPTLVHDPEINRSYGGMAAHYGEASGSTAVSPEGQSQNQAGAHIVQIYVLEHAAQPEVLLSRRIKRRSPILVQLNGRVMRRLGVSRRELLETVQRPAMLRCQQPSMSMPNGR